MARESETDETMDETRVAMDQEREKSVGGASTSVDTTSGDGGDVWNGSSGVDDDGRMGDVVTRFYLRRVDRVQTRRDETRREDTQVL